MAVPNAFGVKVNCRSPSRATGEAEANVATTGRGTKSVAGCSGGLKDNVGIGTSPTVTVQEKVAVVEPALSSSESVKGAGPSTLATPETVVVGPVFDPSLSQGESERLKVYGSVPPDAVNESENVDPKPIGLVGQGALGVITSGSFACGLTMRVLVKEILAPAASVTVTVNVNVPGSGGVPDRVTLAPVVGLSESQSGPVRVHL